MVVWYLYVCMVFVWLFGLCMVVSFCMVVWFVYGCRFFVWLYCYCMVVWFCKVVWLVLEPLDNRKLWLRSDREDTKDYLYSLCNVVAWNILIYAALIHLELFEIMKCFLCVFVPAFQCIFFVSVTMFLFLSLSWTNGRTNLLYGLYKKYVNVNIYQRKTLDNTPGSTTYSVLYCTHLYM